MSTRDEWRAFVHRHWAELRPVPTPAELMALPDPRGAWWRAHFAHWDEALTAFEAEHGAGSAEQAMLSVFPQPMGAWNDTGEDDMGESDDEPAADLPDAGLPPHGKQTG